MLPLTLTSFLLRPCVLFPRWPFQRALHPHRQLCCCRSRVLAWLLETSPKGVFPPEKCLSCSLCLPWPKGWGSPWREGYPRVGEEEGSFLHSFMFPFPHLDFAFRTNPLFLFLCICSVLWNEGGFGNRWLSVILPSSVSLWHRLPFYKMIFQAQLSLTFGWDEVNDYMC